LFINFSGKTDRFRFLIATKEPLLMYRSASLLGNTIWIVLSVATLLYPCLPARDPNGEVFALSRFDFALLYLTSPETLWLQWTAGLPLDYWTVRFESVVIALVWGALFSLVGTVLLGPPKRGGWDREESWISQWGTRFVFGYSSLQGVFAIQMLFFHHPRLFVSLLILFAVSIAVYVARNRFFSLATFYGEVALEVLSKPNEDRSLDQAWKRRLFGMATISCCLLATFHMLGALVPSVDVEIREERWVNTIHLYEQTVAPNYSTQESLQDTNESDWSAIGQIDSVVISTLEAMQIDARSLKDASRSSTQVMACPAIYPALLASKLISVVVGIAGFVMIWELARRIYGRLPAMMMLLLLLATPSLLELGRLGRMEWVVTSQCAAIVSVLLRRGATAKFPRWLVIMILAIPSYDWLLSLWYQSVSLETSRMGTLIRFAGFSTLYPIPWVACLVIGMVSKPTRVHTVLFSIGSGIFLVLGLVGSVPDRSWIPVLSFFALPVASGVAWLLDHQNRLVGLLAWSGILITSLMNTAYWPTMENRILAPIGWLVFESGLEYGSSPEEVRLRYSLEIQKQLREGKLEPDSKILLIGTRDDLDIPLVSTALAVPPALDESAISELIRQSKATLLGVVSNRGAFDLERKPFGIDEEKTILELLERFVEQGMLKKLPVSAESFDLTLYRVVH